MSRAEAAKWKAKYQSVVGLVEPKHVEAAEKIVEAGIKLGVCTAQPAWTCIEQLIYVAQRHKHMTDPPPIQDCSLICKMVKLEEEARRRRTIGYRGEEQRDTSFNYGSARIDRDTFIGKLIPKK